MGLLESAIGGANITTTIEGRERFPVNVRYQRAYRPDGQPDEAARIARRLTLLSAP